MSFTDKFISIKVPVYDRANAEMIGYNDKTSAGEVIYKINPFEISHYREAYSSGKESNEILLQLKNGDSFQVNMNLTDFEKLLNEHQK